MPKTRRRDGEPSFRARPAPKGRRVDAQVLADVQALLGAAPRRPDLLIEHLHRIQDAYGHIAHRHIVALAWEMRLAYAEVFEVATFYHHFDVVPDDALPPPPLTVRVCESLPCRMAGSGALEHTLKERLGEKVRVIGAPCVGRCAEAPAAVVGRHAVGRATLDTVEEAILAGRTEAAGGEYVGYDAYRNDGGYQLLQRLVRGEDAPSAPPAVGSLDDVLRELSSSGLRGLGGAGFPAGRKWEFVRKEPVPRLLAVNADEGEPGTFKDRWFLERDPHRVLEGMLIAAWAVDATEIYFYLRDEYPHIRRILEVELARLAADPPCPIPPIQLRRGAGAYICGEETALIESLEGRRGQPRLRPPFPAQVGVFGRPTLVHNVETLYWIREILEEGGEAFAAAGIRGRKGKRAFSVSGRVVNPGVYIAPAGTTIRELIDRAGGMLPGHEFYGYLPGGASGGILPARLGDVPLDFDVLAEYGCFIGSAALIVLSDQDRAVDAALNVMRFFAHESCGKCTPCRAGTEKSVQLMEEPTWDLPLLKDLGLAMADASICGLGQAAPNVVRSVAEFFPEELGP
jgi:formate dehydrogenase beta subunit